MPNFTRMAIKASFMKLLSEYPLNKITVRSIVEDCGINRNSFYYHFQDIPSLIEEIVTESADALVHKYPKINSIDECFTAAFQFLLENKKAILHIFNSVSRDIFERYLMRTCDYVVRTYIGTVFGDNLVDETDHYIIIKFFKCELVGASLEWVSEGMPDDSIKELHHLLDLCSGLSSDIIKRCNQKEGENK